MIPININVSGEMVLVKGTVTRVWLLCTTVSQLEFPLFALAVRVLLIYSHSDSQAQLKRK